VQLDGERAKRWATPLRVGVSLSLLALAAWKIGDGIEWSQLTPTWSTKSLLWLLAACSIMLGSYGLSTLRWQQVTRALVLRNRFQRLLSHFMAGQFISNALPTTIGGDVVRVARLARDTGDAPSSFASVVLERLSGWVVLPAITFLGFLLNPALQNGAVQTRAALGIAGATLVGLGLLLFAADHPSLGGRFVESAGWRRFARALHVGVSRLRHRPWALAAILGAGFIYQFALVLAAYLVALALDINVGITALMAFFPAVLMAQVIPISVAGLGVREFMLVWLLGSVGVPTEKALALGILIWAITVVTSLVGAPSYAMGGRRLVLTGDAAA
jgi:glycosyltransferase 2 family protein